MFASWSDFKHGVLSWLSAENSCAFQRLIAQDAIGRRVCEAPTQCRWPWDVQMLLARYEHRQSGCARAA